MFHSPNIKINIINIKGLLFDLFLLVPLFCSIPFNVSWALTNDQFKPFHISAKSVTYNHDQHKATFTGDVIATQGTTRLSGNKIILYLSSSQKITGLRLSSSQKITELRAVGNLAHYSTLPDNEKHKIHAQAKEIIYDPNKKIITLLKNGKITKENNVFSGPHISYDILHGIVRSTPTQEQQKTIVYLQPEVK